MAGAKIALSNTSGELKTDGNDNAAVNLPLTEADAGYAAVTFEQDAGTVTGSKYLLERGDLRLLIDCGLYQGLKPLRLQNWEPRSECATKPSSGFLRPIAASRADIAS